jgi:hypothetical protein
LAHASPNAAKPLLERIEERRMRDYAAGYLDAARAYAAAREEVGEAWVKARVFEAFNALPTPEARAGFLAYALERSLPFVEFEIHRFGSAARVVMKAFWDEAKRLAVSAEPADWRALLDKFVETYDPEYVGKALANAALAGEEGAFFDDKRVQGFIKKEGDVARFEEWWRTRPEREEEYERGVQACEERLQEIAEGVAELRSGLVVEPGEALSLRMHAELEVARLREEVAERLDQLGEVEARIRTLEKLADEYLLPRHPLDALRDWARRLREALTDLDAKLK